MRLTDQLDLVDGIARTAGLVGLERNSAMSAGDEDRQEWYPDWPVASSHPGPISCAAM